MFPVPCTTMRFSDKVPFFARSCSRVTRPRGIEYQVGYRHIRSRRPWREDHTEHKLRSHVPVRNMGGHFALLVRCRLWGQSAQLRWYNLPLHCPRLIIRLPGSYRQPPPHSFGPRRWADRTASSTTPPRSQSRLRYFLHCCYCSHLKKYCEMYCQHLASVPYVGR